MKLTTEEKWRLLLSWLRREFPPPYPVSVRRRPLKIDCGECGLSAGRPRRFLIVVHRPQCFRLQVDALIHEWAHACTWGPESPPRDVHSAEWGVMYARIYRRFLVWDYGKTAPQK